MILSFLVSNFLSYSGNLNRGRKGILKFGTPTIALPLAIKKCTVQTGCTVYVCGQKKNLNRTLAIDLPFQTYTVGLLFEFIDWF